jgi:hypothetical protein
VLALVADQPGDSRHLILGDRPGIRADLPEPVLRLYAEVRPASKDRVIPP